MEIVGNALCLDFANTVSARPVARWDALATADQAMEWTTLVGHPLTDSLPDLEAELAHARELRENVYRVFHSVAHGDQPSSDELDALLAAYSDAVSNGALRADGNRYELYWTGVRTVEVLRWEVAASSVDVLTRGNLERLGECPSCRWLFLDTSKNGRRRWCSMTMCGSRDKARRYYARRAS